MAVRVGWVLVLVTLSVRTAVGQGYAPTESAARMTVPDDLAVSLVASEPLIRQPVCIEFDDRGRLWVIQYLQYPNPEGLTRVSVDRYSRTTYDKVPPPPPHGPKGADRITILEDTDHDGDADTAKDFAAGLNMASGLAFGHGGVFVLNPPYLLFYPDRNGDDVPDADPDVLLTGFGIEDAHSVANSLTWGPDGWLYGCQGSTVTANVRGVEFQQGVWRYHPLTRKFELFCEGGGNSWGLDFDPKGHLLYNTNYGGYVMLHGVQGAYYWKLFTKHGGLHNPFAYGYIDHVPHANFRGGHVSVGGILYQGDRLPERFRGKFISPDLLDHSVHWHDVAPNGSSFRTAHGGDLLAANDTWFASSDATMGPDGAIYVADWHDQRTAHPDPDADWDRRNGRVYRIAAKGAKPHGVQDVSGLSRDDLLAMLSHPSNWFTRRARRVLADRRDPEVILPLRRMVTEGGGEQQTLGALWALYVSGGLSDGFAADLLGHRNPDVRRWAVRLVGDESRVTPEIARKLAELAASEADVHVRSQLASTAKRLPANDGLPVIEKLVTRDADAGDPHIPLLLWWAVERHAISARGQVVEFFASAETWKSSLARDGIIGRLTRRYAAEGDEGSLAACAQLLESAPSTDERRSLLAALDQGLAERQSNAATATVPALLRDQLRALWTDDTTDVSLIRVRAALQDPTAIARALTLAAAPGRPTELRVTMLQTVGEFGRADDVPALLDLLRNRAEPEAIRLAALAALGRFEDARIADAILAGYAGMTGALRPRAVDLLAGRKAWATQLVRAVDAGAIAAADVTLDQLRQIALHGDRALDAAVQKRWGKVAGGTPGEKLAEVRRLNNDLRAGSGNPAAGRDLFKNACGVCHKLFDEGGAVGPDLTHANRTDRDYLLVSIVDPSSVVRAEQLSYLVRTTDGRVLSGLMAEQTPAHVVLLDAKGERVTVPREKVQTIKESPVSLMPEGLLSGMKPQQLRDLFSYLQHDRK